MIRDKKTQQCLCSLPLMYHLTQIQPILMITCINYRVCACISRTFFDKNLPSKIGVRLCTEYYVLLTTEPVTPVLYVVKLPVEAASVWDCYLGSYWTRANAPTYYPVGFEVLTAVSTKMAVFWVVATCSLVVCSLVSAYFDYMRAADTIDSQKSEDRDITDKLP
jgi:hypothetical protein